MANTPEIYGYIKRTDCENDYHPENLHLDFEDDTYGRYFVRADNNKILEKSTDKMATTTTVETRTNANIARGFHDKVNHIIYLVDCDYDGGTSYVWSIDLSDDSILEITPIPADVFDVWIYSSEIYIVYFGVTGYDLLTSNINPDGDDSIQWAPKNPAAGTNFSHIDEGTPANFEYIDSVSTDHTDVYTMEDLDLSGYDSYDGGAGEQIYQITAYVMCDKSDSSNKAYLTGDQTGMIKTEIENIPGSAFWAWRTVTWSGLTLTNAELNALKLTLESDIVGAPQDVRIRTIYLVIYYYGDNANSSLVIENLTTPATHSNDMGAFAGRSWDISQISIVDDQFWFNFKWSNENVELWRYDISLDTFLEMEDCGATTELPPIQQHAISYDDDDILYFVLGTGTAEVSTIIAEVPANIDDGDYITYSAMEKNAVTGEYAEKDYYIWFDKAGDESGDPAPADKTEILVDISAAVTDQDVSDAIESAVNAITLITCDNAAGLTCTLTCHYNGNTTNIADVDAGLVVATTVPGVANLYYLYTYGITDDALNQKGLYPIALMLNRNTDSTNTPEALALEKAFHLTEMRVYQISRAKGNLNIIANWLTSRSTNNTIVSITDSYVIINNDGTYECWEYIDVMDTLIVQSIINTEERMRPSCNILYLKKADYNDPPIEGQMYTIFGRYSSANLGDAFYMNYPDNFNLETAGAITVAGDMDWLDTLTLPDTCSATLGTLNGHKNVLGISHAGVDDPIVIHQFDAQLTSGAYEWWWGSSDVSRNQTIRFKGSGIAVYLRIIGSKYYYLDSIDAVIEITGVTPTNNILDHFRLEFDCATDLFDLYINGTLRVDGGEFNNVDTYIDELYMASITDAVYTQYIDAPCDISHANCYAGKNRVQYNDDQVIFEGRIKDHNLDIVREMFALSQSIELERIHPTITDYTNYTGKTTGPIITQLLSDFSNYVTSGTISAGTITWTCPADWEAQGDKNLLTIINELCDSEYFTWRLNPKGELDADDGSTETFIKFQSTDEYSNPDVEVLSQDINQVIVYGGLVGTQRIGPFTANDEVNQSLTGGIITWGKTYAGVLNETDLQTIADNKLLLQGASPLIFDCEMEFGGAAEFGFVQCGETIYIDSNVRVSEGSDEYVTVGDYILYKNDLNAKDIDSEVRLSEGILWRDHNPAPTLDQQNNQMILQLAETVSKIAGGLTLYLQQDASADIGGYLLTCTDYPLDAKTEVMNITVTATDQELEQWATPSGCPGRTELLTGIYSLHAHTYKFSGTKDLRLYFKVYKRVLAGAETLLGTSEKSDILAGAEGEIDIHAFVDHVALLTTDRIVLKIFAVLSGVGSNPVIYFYVEGNTLSRLLIPVGAVELGDVVSDVAYAASWNAVTTIAPSKNAVYDRLNNYIHLREEQAQGTNGGTFTSGAWRTRVLNVEVTDQPSACVLAANQFTLLAGTYRIHTSSPIFDVGQHQVKLYNITDVADEIIGQELFCSTAYDGANRVCVVGLFTIADTKVFELQHRCTTTKANTGFGNRANFTTEVYSEVQLWKVA